MKKRSTRPSVRLTGSVDRSSPNRIFLALANILAAGRAAGRGHCVWAGLDVGVQGLVGCQRVPGVGAS